MFRYYIPAIVAVVAALVFIAWPVLAAVFLAGLLFMFAFFYAAVVYQFHKFKNSADDMMKNADFHAWQEPNVRNVTVYLRQRGSGIFR